MQSLNRAAGGSLNRERTVEKAPLSTPREQEAWSSSLLAFFSGEFCTFQKARSEMSGHRKLFLRLAHFQLCCKPRHFFVMKRALGGGDHTGGISPPLKKQTSMGSSFGGGGRLIVRVSLDVHVY
jgi:hypothetical protein